MGKLIVYLAPLLLITACATSKPSPATASTSGTPPADQKLICTESTPMGTHIPQRICITQDQYAARKKADQEALRNAQMQGGQGQPGGSGPP
jgi:hypothetical protein